MYVVPGTELVPVSRSCYYKLNASIKAGREQAAKGGSEVLRAQRVILCVFISATLFHWSHKRKWTQDSGWDLLLRRRNFFKTRFVKAE